MVNKRVVAVALLLIVSILAVPAAAQVTTTEQTTDGPTTTTTTQADTPTTTSQTPTTTTTTSSTTTSRTATAPPPTTTETPIEDRVEQYREGEYSLEELSGGGERPASASRDSMRYLGSGPEGFVFIEYQNPSLYEMVMGSDPSWSSISSDTRVEMNDVRVQATAWGSMEGEYTLKTVYWQRDEMEIDNQTVPYAANQSEERAAVTLGDSGGGDLYSTVNASLVPHYDEPYQVTMFLEDSGGDVVAQWTFEHLSNPVAKQVDISSSGALWAFSIRNVLVPGAGALIAGLVGAWLTLKRTGRGPGYGVGSWLLIVLIVGSFVMMIATYQIAVLLQNAPWIMGASFFAISYSAGLTFHSPVKEIGFFRRELVDADTTGGDSIQKMISDGAGDIEDLFGGDSGAEIFDELTEAVYVDLPSVPAVRTEEKGYKVPVTGVRPFIARLFASAAVLDVQGIATRTKVKIGKLDDIIYVDPSSDPALEHKAATMVRVLPIDTLPDDSSLGEEIWAYALTGIILFSPAAAGSMAFARLWNIPSVGIVAGLIVTAVIAFSAEDGWIDFKPAPPHYKPAEDSLTMLQRAYKAAKEDSSGQKAAREERAKTAREARNDSQSERKTVTDEMLEDLGVDEIAIENTDFDFDHDYDGEVESDGDDS